MPVMNTYTFIDHSSALLVAKQQELCLQHGVETPSAVQSKLLRTAFVRG
jgi:hypothetical protein